MVAPALPDIAEHYHITSETITAMVLSIFLITFAIGPLFLAPLSEIYGRTWVSEQRCITSSIAPHPRCQVFHINNGAFAAVNLACAYAPNTNVLLGMRIMCTRLFVPA